MKNIDKRKKEYFKIIVTYYFVLVGIALFLILVTEIRDSQALSLKERVCQKSFIGYEYNPKLEKRCSTLWKKWTSEILSLQTKEIIQNNGL